MPDPTPPYADPNDGGDLSIIDLNRTPLGGRPFNLDPPDPDNPGLDGGQVLYHMALGAKPEDFHPNLQPLAQGYGLYLQPPEPKGPGLLGSLEDIRPAAAGAPSASETSTDQNSDDSSFEAPVAETETSFDIPQATTSPITLDTTAPGFSYTPTARKQTSAPKDQRVAFIKTAIPAAIASEKASGAPASVTIAQAVLESSNGTKHMGDANNYFGLKAQTRKDGSIHVGPVASGYTLQPTKEFQNGRYVAKTAPFRSYNSMAASFIDHARFVSGQPRYVAALGAYQNDRDAEAFARGLQAGGYATDPHYAEKLIGLINQYNLRQYDQ